MGMPESWRIGLATAAIALVLILASGAAGTAQDSASPAATPTAPVATTPAASPAAAVTAVTMIGREMALVPSTLTIPADTAVTVTFVNRGLLPHNFRIDELKIDVDVQRRQQRKIVINAPAGTYKYYCDVPGHAAGGVWGTLTVVSSGAAGSAGHASIGFARS